MAWLGRAFRTTRGRLTLLWVAVCAAALAVADLGLYAGVTFRANAALNEDLRSQAAAVSAGLRVVDGGLVYGPGTLPHESESGLLVDVAVVAPEGIPLLTPDQPLGPALLRSLADPVLRSGRPALSDFTDAHGGHRRAFVARVPAAAAQPAALVVSTSLKDAESDAAQTTLLIAVLSLAVLAGSTGLVNWVIGRVLSPVSRIARLADSLSEHELHRRVDVIAPDDEVGQLVVTFNRMLGRLERSFAALHSFTADASHELRSPLALMATELEYATARPRPAAERERVLRELQSEVRHMTDTVERLLMLARVDAGELRSAPQELDVVDLAHEAGARWEALAAARGVRLEVTAPDSGSVLADPGLVRRIFDNLLDNAIRHSPAGAPVRISACRDDERWLFEIADRGPGIPPEQADHAFQRFARADSARSRDGAGGAGLGLPLSLGFARAQHGDLRLVQQPGWGAVLQLRLPAPPPFRPA